MRVSIYARYSSDKQREASIEDQIRLCEERAASRKLESGETLHRSRNLRGKPDAPWHSGADAGCAKREVRSRSYGVAGPNFS